MSERDSEAKSMSDASDNTAGRDDEYSRGYQSGYEYALHLCAMTHTTQAKLDAAKHTIALLSNEMTLRDEQWLEMIALCDKHMAKMRVLDDSIDAWITVSKNLGVARVVIEGRRKRDTEGTRQQASESAQCHELPQ